MFKAGIYLTAKDKWTWTTTREKCYGPGLEVATFYATFQQLEVSHVTSKRWEIEEEKVVVSLYTVGTWDRQGNRLGATPTMRPHPIPKPFPY